MVRQLSQQKLCIDDIIAIIKRIHKLKNKLTERKKVLGQQINDENIILNAI